MLYFQVLGPISINIGNLTNDKKKHINNLLDVLYYRNANI